VRPEVESRLQGEEAADCQRRTKGEGVEKMDLKTVNAKAPWAKRRIPNCFDRRTGRRPGRKRERLRWGPLENAESNKKKNGSLTCRSPASERGHRGDSEETVERTTPHTALSRTVDLHTQGKVKYAKT